MVDRPDSIQHVGWHIVFASYKGDGMGGRPIREEDRKQKRGGGLKNTGASCLPHAAVASQPPLQTLSYEQPLIYNRLLRHLRQSRSQPKAPSKPCTQHNPTLPPRLPMLMHLSTTSRTYQPHHLSPETQPMLLHSQSVKVRLTCHPLPRPTASPSRRAPILSLNYYKFPAQSLQYLPCAMKVVLHFKNWHWGHH